MSVVPSNPCATCGLCCRSYIVPVCGYDVWLISTREHLSPEQYLILCPQEPPGLDGFRLSADSPPYGLALDKKGRFEAKRPCVFLVQMAGGHDRCGIYDHRPVVCQGYPMAIWSGVVFKRSESMCPPNSWPEDAAQRPGWRAALQRFYMYMDIYIQIVARWNSHILARPGYIVPAPAYFDYLLNIYDRLDSLTQQFGPAQMAQVEAEWPTVPRPATDLVTEYEQGASVPWLQYLMDARAITNSFFPHIPVSPTLSLTRTY